MPPTPEQEEGVALRDVKTSWRQGVILTAKYWLLIATGFSAMCLINLPWGEGAPAFWSAARFSALLTVMVATAVVALTYGIALAFWPWTRHTRISRKAARDMENA